VLPVVPLGLVEVDELLPVVDVEPLVVVPPDEAVVVVAELVDVVDVPVVLVLVVVWVPVVPKEGGEGGISRPVTDGGIGGVRRAED
jgi:hypothetical protein